MPTFHWLTLKEKQQLYMSNDTKKISLAQTLGMEFTAILANVPQLVLPAKFPGMDDDDYTAFVAVKTAQHEAKLGEAGKATKLAVETHFRKVLTETGLSSLTSAGRPARKFQTEADLNTAEGKAVKSALKAAMNGKPWNAGELAQTHNCSIELVRSLAPVAPASVPSKTTAKV